MQTYSAREHAWQRELDGIQLAGFRRRAFAFLIDWTIVGLVLSLIVSLGALAYLGIAHLTGHSIPGVHLSSDTAEVSVATGKSSAPHKHFNFNLSPPSEEALNRTSGSRLFDEINHFVSDILVPILYFGILLWRGKGQTPGKRLMKIRVVSIVHPHLSFWHSVERALGYGAAALEAGFGFAQYFIHPYRRCAQDRLAETIVVTEPAYQRMLASHATHHAE